MFSFLTDQNLLFYRYGINQFWKITLIDASRALRRNVLHGGIWGNPIEHDNKDDDYDDKNLSSNSNDVITNRKRSLSTTSQSRGRVRDMIDTLERSSSTSSLDQVEEGNWTRGNKDTTSNRDNHHHHRHRHYSFGQQQRQQQQQQQQQVMQQQGRLPQRGSVSTLFETSGPGLERETEDGDSTITAHTRRNVKSNTPRLLPFPPIGPSQFVFLGLCKWSFNFFFSAGTSNQHYAHIVSPSHTG